jgi:MFS family permease
MEKHADPEAVIPATRGNSVGLAATADPERIEAPVTWKAYLMCAFASFGGIFFGYDSGYINGVTGSEVFIRLVQGNAFVDAQIAANMAPALTGGNLSLITSILSAGTFFGALIAGDMADIIGRKWTVVMGCVIYIIGK